MIGALLPAPVVTAEAFGDPAVAPELFPEEAALVERAVPERQREFTTVRALARTALGRLGHDPAPILPGVRGAPRWPTGVVGSMTHCRGYRAAAMAHAADLVTVGIDAEPNLALPNQDVLETVLFGRERTHVRELGALRPEVSWDRLVFSAKESVYKAWFPLTGLWLDFDQATLRIDPEAGTFHARLLVPGPEVGHTRLSGFDGRWQVDGGLIVTTIAVYRKDLEQPDGPPSGAPGN
ncbi:4'-phosphopantetheinyl transferase [Streptomyces sp. NPDC048416]|uniref:4'-phosphopantetheinyl transferase family protein n=1 Tax=Streptomyces sp. NPDC048416 TaxID=3365546 RepID=UPI003718333D